MAIYFVYPIFIVLLFLIASYIFFNLIYTKYKLRTTNMSFADLMTVLNATINTELELYEKDVFSIKGSLSNSNFDNFYIDITTNILTKLSDTFFLQMSAYLTEEAIGTIIGRAVKIYLTEKITGTV